MILEFVRHRMSSPSVHKDASEFARIKDAVACRSWLARLMPHDTNPSLQTMAFFLQEIVSGPAHATLRAEQKFSILEEIRAPILRLLQERLQEVEARTSPPSVEEAGTLWDLTDATIHLRDAYADLVARLAVRQDNTAAPSHIPCSNVDALHRAISLSADLLMLILHARVRVPVALWQQHCVLGKQVRQMHCQDEAVKDPHLPAQTSSQVKMHWTCREAFVAPILFALADPSSLGRSECLMLRLASQHWAKKVGFRIDLPAARLLTHRHTKNPGPTVELAGHLVRFDSQRLIRQLDRMVGEIDDGKTPKDWAAISTTTNLGLGVGRSLIEDLEHYWGAVEPESIDAPGQSWRKPTSGFALAVVGMQAMTGGKQGASAVNAAGIGRSVYKTHRLPEESPTRSREEMQKQWIENLLEGAETWSLLGETTDMLLCTRRLQLPRLYLHQMVGLKQGSRKNKAPYHLGWIVGLQQATNGLAVEGNIDANIISGIGVNMHADASSDATPDAAANAPSNAASDSTSDTARQSGKGLPIRLSSTQIVRVHLFPGRARPMRVALDDGAMVDCYLLVPLDFTESKGDTLLDLVEEGEALDQQIQSQPERFSLIMPVASWRAGRDVKIVVHGVAVHLGLKELLFRGLDFDYVSLRRSR